MAKNVRTEDFKLENVRLSYPYLFRPRKREENGVVKLSYEAVFLYPKGGPLIGKTVAGAPLDIAVECARIATEHWGEKAVQMIKDELIKNPFKDGDSKDGINKKSGERNPGYAGMKFIRVAANAHVDPLQDTRKPVCLSDKLGADGKLVKLTEPNTLYPGCYVHAVVNAYTWENNLGGKGISFGVSMVQFAKDGEKIGSMGGADPNSFFAPAPVATCAVGEAAKEAGSLFA